MAEIGFVTYVKPAEAAPQTLEERFGELTGAEKLSILDGYSDLVYPNDLITTLAVKKDLVIGVYYAIEEIEVVSAQLMRGEILITEGEYDPETGDEITPPVYNTPPADQTELEAELVARSTGVIFSASEIGVVVDRMVLYSEIDDIGAYIGTWSVYAAEVVK